MNPTIDLTATFPCAAGCQREDGTPTPARHGRYCSRCRGRISTALTIMGELTGHLVASTTSGSQGLTYRVDSSSEAPVPFNQAAFDDANSIYSMLVYWTTVFAYTMRTPAPTLTAGSWRNERGTIVGLPNDITPQTAASLVGTVAGWVQDRLDTILGTTTTDDIAEFDTAIRDVWRINARWPRIEKPAYSAMPCPRQDCGSDIAVYPPGFPGDERRIVCQAGHWYPEEEYEHLIHVFEDEAKAYAKASKVAARLAKKYGIGA